MRKVAVFLVLLILTLAILIMVKPTNGQISTPSAPEFTLKVIDNSYDIPASTSVNPYNGSTIIHPGAHIENITVELSIKNQPYDPNYLFLYGIRVKGHFENTWTDIYVCPDSFDDSDFGVGFRPLVASNSDYTVVSVPANYPSNSQIDFQVKAALYNVTQVTTRYNLRTLISASDWSSTQTITVGDSSSTVTPSSSPLPSSPTPPTFSSQNPSVTPIQSPGNSTLFDLGWGEVTIIALLSAIAVLLVFVVVYLRKRSMKQNP